MANRQYDKKDTRSYGICENTTSYKFSELFPKIKKSIKASFPDLTSEQEVHMVLEELKNFKINDQTFEVEHEQMPNGGLRWYVKCPKCLVRATLLYLPTQLDDREQKYLCKYCHKLKTASLKYGSSIHYNKVQKPLKRLEKIKVVLLNKRLKPEVTKNLLDEYEKLERELNSSVEYRLYKFRKEHGVAT